MSSAAEIVNSGRFPGNRSNFSQMCSLLSQYVKEKKGSFRDLKLDLTRTTMENKETMNLLPMMEKSAPQKKSDLSAQMTIFYAGKVIVFDNFPADKASDIMSLASKASTAKNRPNLPGESGTGVVPADFGLQERRTHCSAQPPLDSDLPIARKNSLARFLEKRKDRVTANAPYPVNKQAKPAMAEAWLGLAPEFPLQIQRS